MDEDLDLDEAFIAEWMTLHGDHMEKVVAEIIAAEDSVPTGWPGVANDRW